MSHLGRDVVESGPEDGPFERKREQVREQLHAQARVVVDRVVSAIDDEQRDGTRLRNERNDDVVAQSE